MIREFGADVFDPATILRGRPGEGWVEVVRAGHVARVNLDAAGVVALRAWLAEQAGVMGWVATNLPLPGYTISITHPGDAGEAI